jgi:membrane protein/epoxyqueuosine reductase
MARRKRSAVRSLGARLGRSGGALISREVGVLTHAIAFNFLLCLFPLLVVLYAVASELPSGRRAQALLVVALAEYIPFAEAEMTRALQGLAQMAGRLELLSLLLIVWGSSGIFLPVEMVLNRAWGGRGPRSFVLSKILAFIMTLVGGLVVLISVLIAVSARSWGKEWPLVATWSVKGSAFVLTLVLFFLVYRLVPGGPVSGTVALRAALWGGCAWEVAKYLFVAQLGRMNLKAFYGPAALAAALLLWAYVSSLALVFGALMTPNNEADG